MSPALLARLPLVTLPEGAGTTRIIDDWLAGREAPGERLCCNNWGAIAGLLIEGTGVGLLPSHWAAALEAEGSLRVLDGEPALAALPYSFQFRRDDARALITQMRDAVLRAADFPRPAACPEAGAAVSAPRPFALAALYKPAHGAESAMRVRGGWAWRRGVASGCLFRQGRNTGTRRRAARIRNNGDS